VTVTIRVKDIDRSLRAIEKHGGKTAAPKQAVGDIGHSAYFYDSEGNLIGLWQTASRS
jgi:predicted enzyme related to lactoylglutathione lyase